MRIKKLGKVCSVETRIKMGKAHKGVANKKLRKRVMCVDTGEVFEWSKDACNKLGVGTENMQYIAKSARSFDSNKPIKALGYQWKYL